MVCRNCGREMDDGELFCPICGTRVEEVPQEEPAPQQEYIPQQEYVPQQEPAPQEFAEPVDYFAGEPQMAPKKTMSKKLWIPIVALVVVAALVITFFASSGIRNMFMEMILSPGKYMAYVYEQELEDSAEIAAKSMIRNIRKQSDSQQLVLDVSANEEMKNILYSSVDPQTQPFVNWIGGAKLDVTTTTEGDLLGLNGALSVNGTELSPINIVNDTANGKTYITLPALSNQALYVTESVQESDRAIVEGITKSVPDEDVLERMLFTYSYTFIKEIANVEKSKETVTVSDMSKKLTVLTANIDNQTISRAQVAVLEAMKTDKDLKKLVEDMVADPKTGMPENAYENLIASIDKGIENAKALAENQSGEAMKLVTYVDGGEIVGIRMESGGAIIENITLEKGNRFNTRISVKGDADVVIEGSGKTFGDKKDGTFAVKISGAHMLDLNVSGLDTDKLEEGAFEGRLELKPADALVALMTFSETEDELSKLLPEAKLVLSGEADRKRDSLKIDVCKGEEVYGTVSLDSKKADGFTVTVPDNAIDANDTEAMNAWTKGIQLDTLVTNLKNAGASQQLTGILELLQYGIMP